MLCIHTHAIIVLLMCGSFRLTPIILYPHGLYPNVERPEAKKHQSALGKLDQYNVSGELNLDSI